MLDLSICGACRGLKGPFRDRPSEPVRVQRCGCGPVDEDRWPGFDFNRVAELCRCCTLQLLRSGLRWSVWLCDPCKARARDLNRRVGAPVVPIGRHSMMHGLGLSGADAAEPDAVEAFAAAAQDLFAAQRALEGWARHRLEENLRLIGRAEGDVPVSEYLGAADAVTPGPDHAFEDLVAHLR